METKIWHISTQEGHQGIQEKGVIEAREKTYKWFDRYENYTLRAAFYVLSAEVALEIASKLGKERRKEGEYYPVEYTVDPTTLDGFEDPLLNNSYYSKQDIKVIRLKSKIYVNRESNS